MNSQLASFFGKNEAERDPAFREQLRERTVRGLRAVAVLAVGVPLLAALLEIAASGGGELSHESLFRLAAMSALAIASYGLSLKPPEWPAAGWWALFVALLVEWVHLGAGFWVSARLPQVYHFLPGVAATILFVAVALIPFRPGQIALLAALTGAPQMAAAHWMRTAGALPPSPYDTLHVINGVVTGLIAVYVAGVLYGQRAAQFRAARDTVAARCRTVMAEHAASLVHLAAGISHEMNNPLGALLSAADTMTAVGRRMAGAAPEERGKLEAAQAAASAALRAAAERLEATVRRLQRLASLDCAEITEVRLREFVESVLETARTPGQLEFAEDLSIRANAAHLGFVLSSLIGVASDLCEPPAGIGASIDGAEMVRIEVRARAKTQDLEPASLFEPVFQETAGRIVSRRWSLFTARQVAREHGGDVHASLTPERVLTLTVCWPASGYSSAATS